MGLKICVIGCGWMADSGHGPSYAKYVRERGGLELAGCCDLNQERAEGFARKHGFARPYTDYVRMLAEERPDAVCLISSVEATKPLAVDVIGRGYPLILEKPPGLNADETRAIAEAAAKAGVPVRVAFNRRYMPLLTRLKAELLQQATPILNITYLFIRKGRKDPDFSTTAIHGIDAVRFLAGSDYQDVRFQYQGVPGCEVHVSNIYMQCAFASGAAGILAFTPMGGAVLERAIVNLPDCSYFLDLPVWGAVDTPGRLIKMTDNRVEYVLSGEELTPSGTMFESNGFYAENAAFFDALRSGTPVVSDIEDAVQSVDIADYIRSRAAEYHV